MSRVRKPVVRYGEWEEGEIKEKKDRIPEKIWEIDDVMKKRSNGENEEVLVKWKDWNGPNTWVGLRWNPELSKFLEQNKANPNSCTMIKEMLYKKIPVAETETNVFALRQAIFDVLGDLRYTPDGSVGRQNRVTVKLPFPNKDFTKHFRSIEHDDISDQDGANVDCYITADNLSKAIGDGWDSRCYKTSTKTFASRKEYIHLTWGYKARFNYDHSACQRCHWNDEENERPEMCNAVQTPILGPPWISLTFTRGRKNMVTGDISRKRKTKN